MAKKALEVIIFFTPIVLIFKNWFVFPFLSAHDFPYYFRETLLDFTFYPPSWVSTQGVGLGGEIVNYSLGVFMYGIVSLFVNTIGLPWELVYRIFIFGLFIVLSIFSSIYLFKSVVNQSTKFLLIIPVLVYCANTYILMVLDGGQIGVSLAYSIAPLVLGTFIKMTDHHNFIPLNYKSLVFSAFSLTVQIMFDLRIALITLFLVLIYFAYSHLFINKFNLKLLAVRLMIFFFLVLGLNAYWIFPIIFSKSHPSQEHINAFSSLATFKFFSFATFPQTLSLLQPNWPENIFGKIYFMRPEFIFLPILAYSSLLFLKTANNKKIIFFVLLGLIGSFLSKGANPPFEQINELLFQYLPGMQVFRDSTKFYLHTALSYSILVPFALVHIDTWIRSRIHIKNITFNFSNILLIFAICYLMFLIRPVLYNQLNGTFKRHQIPKEYIDLKIFLHNQTSFSRTLWIPTQHRYNYYSNLHPSTAAESLFASSSRSKIIIELQKQQTAQLLSNLSIKYVIIPYDSFGEIFVKDRKYNEKEYLETIKILDSISYLNKIKSFGKIVVYEISNPKDHFWIDGKGKVSYKQINPTTYNITVSTDKPSTVVFTDSYNQYWMADVSGEKIKSNKTKYDLNSFYLKNQGTYSITINFEKEQYYKYGRTVTFFFIIFSLIGITYTNIKAKKK